ncbi:MAG TPA: patatin-like phospholipase family protein [Gemmatimonadaceae bacterium]|nr:patatin-like phospholipase family protein [Gemmatimonadaceae bacterium]
MPTQQRASRRRRSPAVDTARSILDGTGRDARPAEVRDLIERLKREYKFDYARRVLNRFRRGVSPDHPSFIELGQQHALCTYKDTDIPVERRLDRAYRILCATDDPDKPGAEQETLGIAGGIWKRRWEATGRKQDLERALAYYSSAVAMGIDADYGYSAVNAALVLELLAAEEERLAGAASAYVASAVARRVDATELRRQVIALLTVARHGGDPSAGKWWFAATLAEAQFGLRDYESADVTLREALDRGRPDEWELESTTQQFATLARLQVGESVDELARSRAWQVVGRLLGADAMGLRGQLVGKTGLALSGGGFRAALFHIGVLARLAELDLLRHIEVISCVSGGSIVGTHYYLKLKQLLEARSDAEIGATDYVKLVQDLEADFLAGVQRNIRMRLFAELTTSVRMLFERGFTRTKRAGELFEEEIFSRMRGDGTVSDRRVMHMKELLVRPKDERVDFHPLRHNWRRRAKVPVLVINATTLNTGHAWQFTATWMGEPPADIDEDNDLAYRLRRLYHDEAPEPYATRAPVRLGHAVAASAAVPGLFDPVDLPGLYAHRSVIREDDAQRGGARPILVRLVDGGVHDNQGVASLNDQDCSVQLVSDASGQIEALDQPKGSPFAVLGRSASVQGARVRIAQFDALASRRPRALDAPFVLHLKSGLGVEHVDWIGCDEPHEQFGDFPIEATPRASAEHRTFYGVNRRAQAFLAGIRTDLDSFSDAEAYALMQSGYQMTAVEVKTSGLDRVAAGRVQGSWKFLRLSHAVRHTSRSDPIASRLELHLQAAGSRFFRVWKTDPVLRAIKWPLLVALASLAAWAFVRFRDVIVPVPRPTVGALGVLALTIVAGLLGIGIVKKVRAIINFEKTLVQYGLSLLLVLGGFVVTRLFLWIFDPIFLRRGALRAFEASGIDPSESPGNAHRGDGDGAPGGRLPRADQPVRKA